MIDVMTRRRHFHLGKLWGTFPERSKHELVIKVHEFRELLLDRGVEGRDGRSHGKRREVGKLTVDESSVDARGIER